MREHVCAAARGLGQSHAPHARDLCQPELRQVRVQTRQRRAIHFDEVDAGGARATAPRCRARRSRREEVHHTAAVERAQYHEQRLAHAIRRRTRGPAFRRGEPMPAQRACNHAHERPRSLPEPLRGVKRVGGPCVDASRRRRTTLGAVTRASRQIHDREVLRRRDRERRGALRALEAPAGELEPHARSAVHELERARITVAVQLDPRAVASSRRRWRARAASPPP